MFCNLTGTFKFPYVFWRSRLKFKPRQHLAGKLMYYVQCVRPEEEEEEEVGEEDSLELQRLARREKNRPVNV